MRAEDLITLPDLAVFPSCIYAQGLNGKERELEMRENIARFHIAFPTIEVLVVDNGLSRPQTPGFAKLFYFPELNTDHPSHGEVNLLRRAIADIGDDVRVLKLHARCRVANLASLNRQLLTSGDFLLLNRNLFSWMNNGADVLPYIDTRVFCLETALLRKLLSSAACFLEKTHGRFEHAMLKGLLDNPDIYRFIKTKGCFYPVMRGQSGHDRDYDSFFSLLRSNIKSLLFRVGV